MASDARPPQHADPPVLPAILAVEDCSYLVSALLDVSSLSTLGLK